MNESISFYEKRKLEILQQMNDEIKRHQDMMKALQYEFAESEKQVQYICANLDSAKILHAEHVIFVNGIFSDDGFGRSRIREIAISRLLDGGGSLFDCHCEWGAGKNLIIGLQKQIRASRTRLNQEQIDDAIYYLRNIERIQDGQRKAIQSARGRGMHDYGTAHLG